MLVAALVRERLAPPSRHLFVLGRSSPVNPTECKPRVWYQDCCENWLLMAVWHSRWFAVPPIDRRGTFVRAEALPRGGRAPLSCLEIARLGRGRIVCILAKNHPRAEQKAPPLGGAVVGGAISAGCGAQYSDDESGVPPTADANFSLAVASTRVMPLREMRT